MYKNNQGVKLETGNNIIKDSDAIEGLMRGVSVAVDLIRPTYGGGGVNGVVEVRVKPFHGVYNDCWSLIKDIKIWNDPAAKIGLDFVKELCERADKLSGDSRKTTLILLEEILKGGYESDINKLQLKRDLDALIPIIEAEIDLQTKQISVDEVEAVATTASENSEIGALLKEIYQKIGKNGIIHPQGSGTYETSYNFIDGVRFDGTGMLSPAMVHDEQAKKDKTKETKAIYENPNILVTKNKIMSLEDLYTAQGGIIKNLANLGKTNLVIFTQDMDSNVAREMINIQTAGGYNDIYGGFHTMNILIIKAPVLWKDYVFEDFAKCVGATIVEDATGVNFKNLDLNHLGTCDKIIVDEDETILMGTKDITEHVNSLKAKGDNDSKLRLSWLVNKTAILKLGANSETDLSYKRLKTHDAIRSSELALKYGVVKGGGVCLAEIGRKMPNTIAGIIMNVALVAPYKQNCENNNLDLIDHTKPTEPHPTPMSLQDFGENIVDASMVLKQAVRNSVGIASTILTASSIVYLVEPTDTELRVQELLARQTPNY